MLHLRGIGKSFANGGSGQNKTRKKVERLVVAFKRVAKKFRRRMETLVARRRRERGAAPPPLPSPFLPALPVPRPFAPPTATPRVPAQQSATPFPASSTEVPRNKTCFRQAGNFICLRCACSRKRTKDTSESRFNQIDRPCLIVDASETCREISAPPLPSQSQSSSAIEESFYGVTDVSA